MKCPRCQHVNESSAKFCEECAAPLARACLHCGHALSATAKFCPGCGRPTEAAGAPAARFASPESFTPKHLAERILASKAALEGERKQVTVLFADLKGSLELLAERDPEEARSILDPVLDRMMNAVHRYEGTVNQVMGDGIMALFGAPIAHEDDAIRACYAALWMQQSVQQYADESRRLHGIEVQIRVGLNSGEVVVRSIGSDLAMDYSAVGQTTHLAARMEQLALPGTIRITAATLAQAEGYIVVKPLGALPIKGYPEPVEAYEVIAASPARSRLNVAASRGLTRFVGRRDELEQLNHAQQLAERGRGQVAAVVGEAGVGKSRLVHEFVQSHRLHGWRVLESSSVSYGKASSYLPVIDLLRAYFKLHTRDEARDIREKVTGKVLTLDRALEPALPALLALLDVVIDDAEWRALDPPQRRQRTLDAVRRLLLREAREQPLLLVFEDLHWIDGETQALLDGLVELIGSARILLVVNYRPEYRHGWAGKTYYSQLRLDALAADGAGELLDALLGDDPGLGALKALLVRRGNPFFLEETVRTLIETKALVGERGCYRLAQPVQAIQMPHSVQAMLAARIDRLCADDKRLVQVASVIGKDLPLTLLQAIAELPDDALRAGLERLQAAEFLYETGLYPEFEYSFKHALTHEVTYGGILHERRRQLHARIIDAIEAVHGEHAGEQVERLAYHALRGERWDKALGYSRQAGLRAVARSANREAVALFEQALRALAHLDQARETLEQAVDLRLDIRQALLPLGDFPRILEHLLEAKAIAETLGDERRLARALSWLAYSYYFSLGDHDLSIATGQRALELGRRLEDVSLQVVATFYLAYPQHQAGRYREAIDGLRWNVAALQGELVGQRFGMAAHPSVLSRALLAWYLGDVGSFAEGKIYAQEAIDLGDALDQPWSRSVARTYLGHFYLGQGDTRSAIALLEESRAIIERWDLPQLRPFNASLLGAAYAQAGRHADSEPLLEHAAASLNSAQVGSENRLVMLLSEAYFHIGRADEAARLAEAGLQGARELKRPGRAAQLLLLLGEIAASRDQPDAAVAEAHLREALMLGEGLGMRPLVARCRLGLGKLYRRHGGIDDARRELGAAVDQLRAMEMTFWLPEAERELSAATSGAAG